MNHRTPVIAAHHILVLYGHWAVNDPRGSGSTDFLDLKFAPLGPIHFGRKPDGDQPSREELRAFHQQHQELLNFPVFWIDDSKRLEIAAAIEEVIRAPGGGYTVYACAVCSNHAHLVIRTHKHKALQQWNNLAEGIRQRLRHRFPDELTAHHPVISARPYSVLLFTPDEVRGRIRYVESNPLKEGLPHSTGPSSPPTTTGRCTSTTPADACAIASSVASPPAPLAPSPATVASTCFRYPAPVDASLDHLPQRKRDDLARVAAMIRAELGDALEMIILYGSYARGDWKEERDLPPRAARKSGHASDYDILILTSTAEAAESVELRSTLDRKAAELPGGLSARPRFIAYEVNAFNQRLSDGRFFYADISKEGCMLYSTQRYSLADPRTLTAEERCRFAQEYYDHWFSRANEHFESHAVLAEKQLRRDAVFHLHQVAETCLKAVLLVHTHYSPDEHWLGNLLDLAAQHDPKLPSILPQQTDEEDRLFKLLDYAYIGARYDPTYKITREELDYLAARVKQLLDRTQAVCTAHLARLKPACP